MNFQDVDLFFFSVGEAIRKEMKEFKEEIIIV
jgi:hypothetical protein